MKKIMLAVFGLGLAVSAVSARAGEWKENHPRRAEVNKRLKNQNKRIDAGVKDGQLTKEQAQQLHKEDRKIRRQERRMAARDGGHITKKDQAKLNREENKVSEQIKDERHPGSVPATPAPAPGAPATPAPAPTSGQ